MTYYDELAEGYNELHGEEQEKKLKLIAQYLKTSDKDSILDVGCGIGLSAKYLKGKITGLDPSEELLKQCPFPTIKGFAELLPFPDHSFDSIICVSAIHNFKDPEQALKEMRRVGKGRLVLSLLKKIISEKRQRLKSSIEKKFEILEVLEDEKDEIFILQSKTI